MTDTRRLSPVNSYPCSPANLVITASRVLLCKSDVVQVEKLQGGSAQEGRAGQE